MEQNVAELPVFDRAWAWFDANRKQVIWGAGAVLVVGAVLGFYFWRQHAVLVEASEALSAVEAQLAIPGGARNESAEAYLKVANEHAGTGAAARALLQGGAVYFAQTKYADAQTQFQRFLREYGDSQYRSQALLGNAACLDALGKADEAAAAYQALAQQAGSVVAPQAKFALARIYESQGRLEQAKALYDELARGEGSASFANEAGVKAEELRQKLPKPPPVVSPAPVVLPTPVVSTNKP